MDFSDLIQTLSRTQFARLRSEEKNWLHIGSEEALETASIHATLVNSCKRLGVNPYLYLRDVFIRLGRGEVNIDDLLPDRWENQNPIVPTADKSTAATVG